MQESILPFLLLELLGLPAGRKISPWEPFVLDGPSETQLVKISPLAKLSSLSGIGIQYDSKQLSMH
jgi:hypothetical protein